MKKEYIFIATLSTFSSVGLATTELRMSHHTIVTLDSKDVKKEFQNWLIKITREAWCGTCITFANLI